MVMVHILATTTRHTKTINGKIVIYIYLLEICLTTIRLKVSTNKSSHTLLNLFKQKIVLHRHIKHQSQAQTKRPTSTRTQQLRTLEETHNNSKKTAHQTHPDLCIHRMAVDP